MKVILIGLSILILSVPASTETCQDSRELESNCGNYCFKVVRPLLDHTKALQSQVDNFINERKILANLEKSEFEQKLEDFRKSNENILKQQYEAIDKKMEKLHRIMEVKKTTVGRPFQKIGSKYYYIEQSEHLNWFGAVHKCVTLGGHLVSIKNLSEFNAIIAKLQPPKHYWIDINDLATEGVYLSATTGLRATYYKWHNGNPDNYYNDEDCGTLFYASNKYLMNDAGCFSNAHFICEADNQ